MLEQLRGWFGRVVSGSSGPPRSGHWEPRHGVSSFHLWWQGVEGAGPLVSVQATLEVLQQPVVPRLYFWALQASFLDRSRSRGAAHIGLQWNPRHPDSTAVNWGGYGDAGNVQSILTGSASPLPSTPADPNTRDYPWHQGVGYRLAISRHPEGWRGEITDTATGETSLIRYLEAGGDRLGGFAVWAEVFCACDDPQTAVRWSGFEARDASGGVHRPGSVRLTFPQGGDCPNTDVVIDGEGLVQLTNASRSARDGLVLPVPASG